jgi:hypothetical protein
MRRIYFSLLSITLCLFLFRADQVQAREFGFQPLLFDIADTPGFERIMTAEDGSLQVFSSEGNMVNGFPIRLENAVFISSPLAADVDADGTTDIVVLSRNAVGEFFVHAYRGTGQLIGNSPAQNAEVYYDPALLRLPNGADDVLVVTTTGTVLQFHFSGQAFTSQVIFSLNTPSAISTKSDGSEIFVSFPGRNSVDVYRMSNNVWARNRSLVVASAWIFAPTFDGGNVLYGVNRANQLIAINAQNAGVLGGFPVNLSKRASASPLLAEGNANNQNGEVIVSLFDGTSVVVSKQGQILDRKNKTEVTTPSVESSDMLQNGFFEGVKNFGTKVFVGTRTILFSLWSRVSPPVVQTYPDINVKAQGQTLAQDALIDLGAVQQNTASEFVILIENTGLGSLLLPNNSVTLNTENGNGFEIVQAPSTVVASQRSTSLRIRFQSDVIGQKTAILQIQSNDPGEPSLRFILQLSNVNNLLRDGNMQLDNVNEWRSWGTPQVKEKSTTFSVSPTKSMRLVAPASAGFQQINVPVLANHRYRYSFRYRIISGQVETNLGIRDSNRDFELKAATLNFPSSWRVYSREFTVPANFVKDFRVILRVRGGEAYFDDVVIEEIAAPISLVLDGTMEANGLGEWRTYGTVPLLEKSASTTHSGYQSLRIKVGPNTGTQQMYIPLRAGRQYRFSFWYRLTGSMIPRLSTTDSNRDFAFPAGDPQEPYLITTNGEWREYSRVFTVPANNVAPFRIVYQLSSSEYIPLQLFRIIPFGEAYIDDVVIEEFVP